jgi:hypothetical protein
MLAFNIVLQILFFLDVMILMAGFSSMFKNGKDSLTNIEKIVLKIGTILAVVILIVHTIYFGGLI